MQGLINKGYAVPRITDLIDISTLQQIQDWAARTAGVSILIRDTDGFPVTSPSMSNEFCNLVSGEEHLNAECRQSNIEAAAIASRTGKPQKYTCYAGLTQFAAPIQIEGQLIGTIVAGDRPTEPISPETIEKLSNNYSLDREKLSKSASKLEPWSDETMDSTINFLYSITNTLLNLCYQGYSLNKNVHELTVLLEINQLLISTLSLQEILDRIAKGAVDALGVKACTMRLLDDEGVELVLKSVYNLSPDYLNKGPVILDEHPVCKAALNGGIEIISDVSTDPRFYYNEEAEREGLKSMLCVGLRSRDNAIGTMHLYTEDYHNFTGDEIKLARSIANQAALVIENAKLYEESIEKQQIERELAMAGEVQAELLPDDSPVLNGFDIKAKIVPCGQLSGDFYDFLELGNQSLGLVIADVSGKGTPGAILMATTHATIRGSSKDSFAVSSVIESVNRYLCDYTRPTEFVTLFYGILDAEKITFTYTNAGHNPPIVFRENLGIFLEQGGIPLGIVKDTVHGEEKIQLLPGDVILFYTDGVTEAMNSRKEIFGVRRLMNFAQRNIEKNAQSLIDEIYNDILEFADGAPQSDDLTLIVLKVKAPSAVIDNIC